MLPIAKICESTVLVLQLRLSVKLQALVNSVDIVRLQHLRSAMTLFQWYL